MAAEPRDEITDDEADLAVTISVLLIEDSQSDAVLIASAAATSDRSIDLHTVRSLTAGIEAIDAEPNRFDLVLLDLHLPDAEGLECVDLLYARHPQIPIAVLTGTDDNRLATGAVARGAQEFLVKTDLNSARLDRLISQTLIRNEQRITLDRTQQALQQAEADRLLIEQRLAHQRRHDPLTGLPNRWALVEHLHWVLPDATPEEPVVLLLVDVRHFHLISDSAGPDVADQVRAALAGRLRRAVGANELLARVEGDQVALVCRPTPGASRARAEALLEQLRQPLEVAGERWNLDAHVGIALAGTATRTDQIMGEADAALARARSARDNITFYDASMRAEAAQRLNADALIRAALRGDGLELYFQPLVEIDSAQMVGVEALLRLRAPDGRLFSPDQFIPVAEENGLIVPLGRWVIEEAGRWATEWRSLRNGNPFQVGVNVSARQLGTHDLVEITNEAVLGRSDADGLTVELTETTLIDATDEVDLTLSELRRHGHKVAIDDFGTGYSGLTYLWRYEVDVLKIDKSFVQAMDDDPTARDIVGNVVQLGKAMGLTTVAEGVETPSQRRLLAQVGCDEAQGYLFAHPDKPEVITELMTVGQPLG